MYIIYRYIYIYLAGTESLEAIGGKVPDKRSSKNGFFIFNCSWLFPSFGSVFLGYALERIVVAVTNIQRRRVLSALSS
jgi:hypothetical protein